MAAVAPLSEPDGGGQARAFSFPLAFPWRGSGIASRMGLFGGAAGPPRVARSACGGSGPSSPPVPPTRLETEMADVEHQPLSEEHPRRVIRPYAARTKEVVGRSRRFAASMGMGCAKVPAHADTESSLARRGF